MNRSALAGTLAALSLVASACSPAGTPPTPTSSSASSSTGTDERGSTQTPSQAEFGVAPSVRTTLSNACASVGIGDEIFDAAGQMTLTDFGDVSDTGVMCVFRPDGQSAEVREGDFLAVGWEPSGRETFVGKPGAEKLMQDDTVSFADEAYWIDSAPGTLIAFKGRAVVTVIADFSMSPAPTTLTKGKMAVIAAEITRNIT